MATMFKSIISAVSNKRAKIVLLIVPLFIYLFLLPSFIIKKKSLLHDAKYRVFTISDEPDNGNSTIESLSLSDDSIHLHYTLRSGFYLPYVGFILDASDYGVFKASGYNYITLMLQSDVQTSFKVHLVAYLPANKVFQNSEGETVTHAYYTALIKCTPEFTIIRIPFSEFAVPEWWLQKNSISKDQVSGINLRSIYAIHLVSSSIDRVGQSAELIVTDIAFEKSILRQFLLLSLVVAAVYAVISVVWVLIKTRLAVQKAQRLIRVHEELDIGNEKEQKAHTVLEYIAKNYNSPYLTVNDVATELGVSEYTISPIIQQYTELSFPQYINTLRLDEAKRLLIESEGKIIDIAFAVGYNTVAHFNKLFKKQEGLSPNEYRQKFR